MLEQESLSGSGSIYQQDLSWTDCCPFLYYCSQENKWYDYFILFLRLLMFP